MSGGARARGRAAAGAAGSNGFAVHAARSWAPLAFLGLSLLVPSGARAQAPAEGERAVPARVEASRARPDAHEPAPPAVRAAIAQGPLTLSDVIALALQNNPQARAAAAAAEGASAAYGSAKGRYFPTLSFDPTLSRTQSLAQAGSAARPGGGGIPLQRTQLTPSLTMSYLLFDFGGRGGTIASAQEAAEAANATSDATVQSTVLAAEGAYFGYSTAQDVLAAQEENVRSAAESQAAAVDRYHVGLATVADTLQAATALAQAQLGLLTAEGGVQTARGNLAAVIGASAEVPFTVARPGGLPAVRDVAANVDSLITQAVRDRPDLAAVEAQALGARDQVRVARSAEMPALSISGNAGRAFTQTPGLGGNTYGLTLGIDLPLFNGFSKQNDVKAAAAQADAADARADAMRVQVANQVFTSYANLKIATARVAASAQALVSAIQSEDVARGRYREGVGTFIDLIVAQSALASARAQDAEARWGWYSALAQLAHDAGTLDRTGAAHLPMQAAATPSPAGTTSPRESR